MPYQPRNLLEALRLRDHEDHPEYWKSEPVTDDDLLYFLDEMSRLNVKRMDKEKEHEITRHRPFQP